MDPELIVVSGPMKGERLQPGKFESMSFGRGEEADIRIKETRISRVHFVIERRGAAYFVKDLKSKNGTFVNDEYVTSQRLYHEDLIRVGDSQIVFLCPDHIHPSATTHLLSPGGYGRPESTTTKLADEIIEDLVDTGARSKGFEGLFLKLLYGLNNLASKEVHVIKLGRSSLHLIAETLGAERAVLFDPDMKQMVCLPTTEKCREVLSPPIFDIVQESVSRGVNHNRTVSVRTPTGEHQLDVLCGPLRGYEGAVGALYLDRERKPVPESAEGFPREFLSISALVGRHLGLALDRARLVHEKFLSEERYRILVEKASDCIFLLDPQGRFTFANPRVDDVFGFPMAELRGRHFIDLVPEEFRETAQGRLVAVAKKREADHLETEVQRKDGGRPTLSLSLAPLEGKDGSLVGLLGIGRDVTRERRMQETIYRSERLSSLGKLVSGVGHELNNPLTTIIGFAQLMIRDPSLPAPARKRIELIFQEGERAKGIVANLLTFARPPRSNRTRVILSELIDQSLTLVEHDIQSARIEVMRFYEETAPVLTDPSQMMEVFLNLLSNGIQAIGGRGGKGRIIVKVWQIESSVHASITDDGPGIDPEHMPHVFDPFFTTKDVGKGTGLGLSMCYKIVTGHGGTISIDSQPGEGTAVEIAMPIAG